MTMTSTDTPRIYVACLASYNNGDLHGRWIDADDADTMREEVAAILRESKYPNVQVDCPECDGVGCDKCRDTGKVPSAEEFAIHDHEGFCGMSIDEYTGIDEVAEIAALIEEHGPAYAAYASHIGGDELPTAEQFQEAYCGEWDSEKAYAEELFDECNEVPDNLAMYIDYDAVARDFFCGDYFSVDNPEGGLFIFRST